MINRMRLVGREPGSAAAIIAWLGGFVKIYKEVGTCGLSSGVGVIEACVVGGFLETASGAGRSGAFSAFVALYAT